MKMLAIFSVLLAVVTSHPAVRTRTTGKPRSVIRMNQWVKEIYSSGSESVELTVPFNLTETLKSPSTTAPGKLQDKNYSFEAIFPSLLILMELEKAMADPNTNSDYIRMLTDAYYGLVDEYEAGNLQESVEVTIPFNLPETLKSPSTTVSGKTQDEYNSNEVLLPSPSGGSRWPLLELENSLQDPLMNSDYIPMLMGAYLDLKDSNEAGNLQESAEVFIPFNRTETVKSPSTTAPGKIQDEEYSNEAVFPSTFGGPRWTLLELERAIVDPETNPDYLRLLVDTYFDLIEKNEAVNLQDLVEVTTPFHLNKPAESPITMAPRKKQDGNNSNEVLLPSPSGGSRWTLLELENSLQDPQTDPDYIRLLMGTYLDLKDGNEAGNLQESVEVIIPFNLTETIKSPNTTAPGKRQDSVEVTTPLHLTQPVERPSTTEPRKKQDKDNSNEVLLPSPSGGSRWTLLELENSLLDPQMNPDYLRILMVAYLDLKDGIEAGNLQDSVEVLIPFNLTETVKSPSTTAPGKIQDEDYSNEAVLPSPFGGSKWTLLELERAIVDPQTNPDYLRLLVDAYFDVIDKNEAGNLQNSVEDTVESPSTTVPGKRQDEDYSNEAVLPSPSGGSKWNLKELQKAISHPKTNVHHLERLTKAYFDLIYDNMVGNPKESVEVTIPFKDESMWDQFNLNQAFKDPSYKAKGNSQESGEDTMPFNELSVWDQFKPNQPFKNLSSKPKGKIQESVEDTIPFNAESVWDQFNLDQGFKNPSSKPKGKRQESVDDTKPFNEESVWDQFHLNQPFKNSSSKPKGKRQESVEDTIPFNEESVWDQFNLNQALKNLSTKPKGKRQESVEDTIPFNQESVWDQFNLNQPFKIPSSKPKGKRQESVEDIIPFNEESVWDQFNMNQFFKNPSSKPKGKRQESVEDTVPFNKGSFWYQFNLNQAFNNPSSKPMGKKQESVEDTVPFNEESMWHQFNPNQAFKNPSSKPKGKRQESVEDTMPFNKESVWDQFNLNQAFNNPSSKLKEKKQESVEDTIPFNEESVWHQFNLNQPFKNPSSKPKGKSQESVEDTVPFNEESVWHHFNLNQAFKNPSSKPTGNGQESVEVTTPFKEESVWHQFNLNEVFKNPSSSPKGKGQESVEVTKPFNEVTLWDQFNKNQAFNNLSSEPKGKVQKFPFMPTPFGTMLTQGKPEPWKMF